VIDEDVAHGTGGDGEELRPARGVDLHVDDPGVGPVDQRRRL
jgi:hypothetical protein